MVIIAFSILVLAGGCSKLSPHEKRGYSNIPQNRPTTGKVIHTETTSAINKKPSKIDDFIFS